LGLEFRNFLVAGVVFGEVVADQPMSLRESGVVNHVDGFPLDHGLSHIIDCFVSPEELL